MRTDTSWKRAAALALVAPVLGAAVPWTAVAQSGDYSGSASGTVAQARLPGPGGTGPVQPTWGESTGAVNSRAGIVPDHPATAEDERQDFAVGSATGVRVTGTPMVAKPGSVQSSAPGDAGGSFEAVGPDPDSLVSIGRASTQSRAAPDGSTASTDNTTSLTESRLIFHLPLRMPTASSRATGARSSDGRLSATGEARLAGDAGRPVSAFGGYVTAAAIEALSRSTATGTSSTQAIEFGIEDLRLNGAPGGAALIRADARPGAGGTLLVELTIAVPGEPPLSETIALPRGSNLLAPSSYQGTTLAPAFGSLTPFLAPLTGPTGPLRDLSIVLGAGYSDAGDGSYARGLIEAVRLSIAVGSATVVHVLGRAYSAADAERAFSTATDPALAPGTPPGSDAALAFPESRTASPTQLAFASALPVADAPAEPGGEPAPALPGEPAPALPGEPGPGRPGEPGPDRPGEPVRDAPDEPASEPFGPAPAGPARAPSPRSALQAPSAAPVAGGPGLATLPWTGLDVATLAALGALSLPLGSLALGGSARRRRRRAW